MLPKHYEILGISKKANDREISVAYRKMSLKYHPDKNRDKSEKEQEEAAKKFLEGSDAYTTLIDHRSRADYDQALEREEFLEFLQKQVNLEKQQWASPFSTGSNNPFGMPPRASAYSQSSVPPKQAAPQQSSVPPKQSAPQQRIPKITEISQVSLTQSIAVQMVNEATIADLELICQIILQQLNNKTQPLRENIQHLLFALLTKPGLGQNHPIKKLDFKNYHLFIVNLVIFYQNQLTLMSNSTLEFFKTYFLSYIADKSANSEFLQTLSLLFSDIFYSDLTFESASAFFTPRENVKDSLVREGILDFIKIYLDSPMPRYSNNAKCLLWSALAIKDNDKILHHKIIGYIQAVAWNYFDTLKKDVQETIIAHLLNIVYGKHDNYIGQVNRNCSNFLLSYLQKNGPSRIPFVLIDLIETHSVFLDYQMSQEQYLEFLNLKPQDHTIQYYFKQLTFDVKSELLGARTAPSQELSPYQAKVINRFEKGITLKDAQKIALEIAMATNSSESIPIDQICNFIITHLQIDDPLQVNAGNLLVAICEKKPTYPSAISRLEDIDSKNYEQFIDHLSIALYSRNMTDTLQETIQKVLSPRLYISDQINAPLLINKLGRILQTIWYTQLTFTRAYSLFVSSVQGNYKDEKRITNDRIFKFIQQHVKSSHPHFSQNAKSLIFAALAVQDSPECSHQSLSKYLTPEYQADFYKLEQDMQESIIKHLLMVIDNPGWLGILDKNAATLVIDYLAQQKAENLPQVLIKLFEAHNHSLTFKMSQEQYAKFKQLNPSEKCDRHFQSLMDTANKVLLNDKTPVLTIHQVLMNYHLEPNIAISETNRGFFLTYFNPSFLILPQMFDPALRSAGELLNRLYNQALSFEPAQALIVNQNYYYKTTTGETLPSIMGFIFLRLIAQFIENNFDSQDNNLSSNAAKLVFAGLSVANQQKLSHGFLSKYINEDKLGATYANFLFLRYDKTICKNLMQALIDGNIHTNGIHYLLNRPGPVLESCRNTVVDVLKLAYDKGYRITYNMSSTNLTEFMKAKDLSPECRMYYLPQVNSNRTTSSASMATALQQYPKGNAQPPGMGQISLFWPQKKHY